MWVFGYGSLMWDRWEAEWGCLRRMTGELQGYARSFNKRSVRNWGTRLCPGPTLNLITSESSCLGIAFEFPEAHRADILAYLVEREGKNFTLNERRIVLEDGTAVTVAPGRPHGLIKWSVAFAATGTTVTTFRQGGMPRFCQPKPKASFTACGSAARRRART